MYFVSVIIFSGRFHLAASAFFHEIRPLGIRKPFVATSNAANFSFQVGDDVCRHLYTYMYVYIHALGGHICELVNFHSRILRRYPKSIYRADE